MSVLADGRSLAEARMTDTCRITTGGQDRVWNAETFSYDEGTEVVSYEGPCRIKQGATQPRTVDAAGQAITDQQLEVHLPVLASIAVVPGDVIEVTASDTDPALVGKRYRVAGSFAQTFATARRLPVEETI